MKARENPFTSEKIHGLAYAFSGRDLADLTETWRENGRRGAIVGVHGAGKSTLLKQVERELRSNGEPTALVFLNTEKRKLSTEDWRALRRLDGRGCLLLDGLEQLSLINWMRVRVTLPKSTGIIATCHHSRRLPTIYRCETSLQLLCELSRKLVTHEQYQVIEPLIPELFERHKGNIRECFRELYDVWSRTETK